MAGGLSRVAFPPPKVKDLAPSRLPCLLPRAILALMTDDPDSTHGGEQKSAEASADTDRTAAPSGETRERRGPPPNPLYHPLFLPVLLVAFSLWFFWDGFITSDPEMQKHQLFNRISFGVTALLCLRVVPRGLREFKEDREAAAKQQ